VFLLRQVTQLTTSQGRAPDVGVPLLSFAK